MSIESLKQQARKHEQNEEWKKALDQYNRALGELAREEQVDIGLYNRVGDLYVRIGELDSAVEHYDRAVELYREAYLPNNAIAVCKKIIRNVPDRHTAYLVIGQIRAEQGFIPDARTNFLTYAERMAQAGDLDESFRALIEFCDLAPDDVGVRMSVADQMIASQREADAVEQLKIVRAHYLKVGKQADADDIESRILNLDPEADLSAVGTAEAGADTDFGSEFGEISFGEVEFGAGSEEEVSFAGGFDRPEPADAPAEEGVEEEGVEGEVGVEAGLEGFEIATPTAEPGDAEPDAVELPVMEAGDEDEAEGEPLPMMDVDITDEVEIEAEPLPTMDFAVEPEAPGEEPAAPEEPIEAEPLPTMDFDLDAAGEEDEETVELPILEAADEGDAEPLPTIGTDFASETLHEAAEDATGEPASDELDVGEAVGVAGEMVIEAPEGTGDEGVPGAEEPVEPEPVAAEAPSLPEGTPAEPEVPSGAAAVEDEPATGEVAADGEAGATEEAAASPPGDGFVDLGAMILGTPEQKSTRFTVAYEEPTGDEEADFARMLSQFKDKVSENLEADDVRAHYDLGTAYKEMGLLDEAISSFQAALRASSDHLPTYELMGQTFMEMGQPDAAVRSLERGLKAADTVEDELVGIYYYLGRAHEELQNRESAVEYYDRVFALDINFADVTERLRGLR